MPQALTRPGVAGASRATRREFPVVATRPAAEEAIGIPTPLNTLLFILLSVNIRIFAA